MESYERKWSSLREYIPFLRKLIEKLESRKGSSAELSKVKSLHRVLSSPVTQEGLPSTHLRMETLLKCEEILKALYEQVEGPRLESPKSPPPAHRGSYVGTFQFQGHPSTHHHHRPPRIIPLERRSGGLEFTHQPKAGSTLTYGEYRRLRQPPHVPTLQPSSLGQKDTLLSRPSPPASPDMESPASPSPPPPPIPTTIMSASTRASHESDEDLTDSESESLQIDEQLPVKKEEEDEDMKDISSSSSGEGKEERPTPIASPDPEEKENASQKYIQPVKRELKPELTPVFFASEKEQAVPEFSLKDAHLSSIQMEELKAHYQCVKSMHDKILESDSLGLKRPARVRLKVTEVKERKCKRDGLSTHDNLVVTEHPESYSHKMNDIIQRLKISGVVEEEASPQDITPLEDGTSEEDSASSDLLPLIQDLKKESSLFHPLDQDITLEKVKTIDNINYLIPLFKCWISSCYYATDGLDDYRSHLAEEKVMTYHCVYCSKDFEVLDDFLDHVIYSHGKCPYQCPYCEFRSTSRLSILIHEQHLHQEENKCYYNCNYLSEENDAAPKFDQVSCNLCSTFSTSDISALLSHINKEHPKRGDSLQLYCHYCPSSFTKAFELLLHHTFKHGQSPFHIGLLEIGAKDPAGRRSSPPSMELICGRSECNVPCQSIETLETHMRECIVESGDASLLCCCFCESNFESLEVLLHHVRDHPQLRYSCSLCSYRDLTSGSVIKHMKKEHGVDKTVCHPRCLSQKDKDIHSFVHIPEKTFKRYEKLKSKKDVYSPDQICEIPRVSMFKSPIYCSECDFVTKVRMNFIKHMKLHKKSGYIGVITPINPPPCVDGRHFKNMGVLNEEEDRVLTEAQISTLPSFVAENQRFACCSPGCNYITVDEVMLLYHIKTLHPSDMDHYRCPHCTGAQVDYEDLGFHIKCHGDLLFKCSYCPYYHWQKRTAQQHVIDTHKDVRGLIRDVRKDAETRRAMSSQKAAIEEEKAESGEGSPKLQYFPFHCGLCDVFFESLDDVKEHIGSTHGLKKQFHCHLCDFASDDRNSLKAHMNTTHKDCLMGLVIQAYFVEQSKSDADRQSHAPLWSRNMIRVRHIRGILFDDDKVKKPMVSSTVDLLSNEESPSVSTLAGKASGIVPYKAKCCKCGVIKKSIKNLKTHIQAVHLKNTKLSCSYCSYSAGSVKGIKIHHKKCHPDKPLETSIELLEAAKFDHEYWKSVWKIPKPHERKKLGYEISPNKYSKDDSFYACKICKYSCNSLKGLKAHNTKTHPSSKLELPSETDEVIALVDEKDGDAMGSSNAVEDNSVLMSPVSVRIDSQDRSTFPLDNMDRTRASSPKKTKDIISAVLEISPFEHVPTFKCLYCPKRTQSLIRIERHLSSEHPNHTSGHRMLTRDQVVEMVTNGPQDSMEYSCYLCDKGGNILELKDHFLKSHPDNSLKVKRRIRSSGYLECQICGHLTPGFDRSQQKVHYHDEHPLEENIVAHKYALRRKPGGPGEGQEKKFDFNRFAGESIRCPREACDFECRSISAIMAHLKKHTQTFKCGHCGNIFTQSSAFHNHSAMMHGDKIPDLVKDMEAEAELEALKALLEASLCKSS